MPKGATSRPNNRKTKKAITAQKARRKLYEKALFSKESTADSRRKARNNTLGTKQSIKDGRTIAMSNAKGQARKYINKVGRITLGQPKASTQRSRVTRKKKK